MLHPTATIEVINAVYRQLAKQHHPDHAGPAGQRRMAEINEAYGILSDPAKRARYDELQRQKGELETRPPMRTFTRATNLKYEGGMWSVRPAGEVAEPASRYGEAGPPPRFPLAKGSVLSFGRYRGWTISQVVAYDRNYVEWLSRTMAGLTYRTELEQALKQATA